MYKTILIFLAIFIISLPGNGQEKILKDLEKEYPSKSFFFYPSTLRMINLNGDKKVNQFFKYIRKMKVSQFDTIPPASTYKNILDQLNQEAFEQIIYLEAEGNRTSMFVKEKKGKPVDYFGIVYGQHQFLALHIRGYIDIGLLPHVFRNFNFQSMANPGKWNTNNQQ
jgi:hypothetical protein